MEATLKLAVMLVAAFTVISVVGVRDVAAGCSKDTDCKGSRVCENGRCVSDDGGGDDDADDTRPGPARDPRATVCHTQMGSCALQLRGMPGGICYCGAVPGIAQ